MSRLVTLAAGFGLLVLSVFPLRAAETNSLQAILKRPIIGPALPMMEVQRLLRSPRAAHAGGQDGRPMGGRSQSAAGSDPRSRRLPRRGRPMARRPGKNRMAGIACPADRATTFGNSASRPCRACGSPRCSTCPRTLTGKVPVDPQRQRPRGTPGKIGRLQADPLHQPGQARHAGAERRVAGHGATGRPGLPPRPHESA